MHLIYLPLLLSNQSKRPMGNPDVLHVAINAVGLSGPQLFKKLKEEYTSSMGSAYPTRSLAFATPASSSNREWRYSTDNAGWGTDVVFHFDNSKVTKVSAKPSSNNSLGILAQGAGAFLSDLLDLDRRDGGKFLGSRTKVYADDRSARLEIERKIAGGERSWAWYPGIAYAVLQHVNSYIVVQCRPQACPFLQGELQFDPSSGKREVKYETGRLDPSSPVLKLEVTKETTTVLARMRNVHLPFAYASGIRIR